MLYNTASKKPIKCGWRVAQWVWLAATIASIGLFSCARVISPPGGPEDKSPPKIVYLWPPQDSVRVPLDATVTIEFDEYIESVKNGAVLLPPVDGTEVKFLWKKIVIEHKAPFEPNTTYRVSISSKISDYRNNRLISSKGFAFSTGDFLDTLDIRGRVFDSDFLPANGTRVHAYLLESGDFPDSLPELPYAVSWTGKNGKFTIRNLPEGDFLLVAFGDIDNDGEIDPGECVAVASGIISSGGETSWSMVEAQIDTSAPELIMVAPENRFVLRFKFSEPIRLTSESDAHSSPEVGRTSLSVMAENPKNLLLFTRDGLPEGELDIILQGIRDFAGNRFDEIEQTITIPIFEEDTIQPKITYSKDRLLSSQPLEIEIDRPIIGGEIAVFDSTGRVIAGTTRVSPPYKLIFQPDANWPSRRDLVWRLRSARIADGSEFSDSTERRINFHDRSSIGSIEVTQDSHCENAAVIGLSVEKDGSDVIFRQSDGKFIAGEVPAGEYIIWFFCDMNEDSTWNPGAVYPPEYSEPIFINGDTIKVRGLWTTELDLKLHK